MKPTKLAPERELLLKSLEKKLSPQEQQRLEEYMKARPALRSEYEELTATSNLLASTDKPSFKPFFADRVMKQVFSDNLLESSDYFFKQLAHLFLRFAFAASVVAVLLGAYNVMSNKEVSNNGDSIIENVFSLPDASLKTITQNTTIISYQDISDDHSN